MRCDSVRAAKALVTYDRSTDLSAYHNWKSKLDRFFSAARINDENDRITPAKIQLVGRAGNWADRCVASTWEQFAKAFISLVIQKLKQLRQKCNAAEYRMKFDEILPCADITDDEARRIFIDGLKPNLLLYVVSQIAVDPHADLAKAETIAVQVDASLFSNKAPLNFPVQYYNNFRSTRSHEPMEIDTLNNIRHDRHKNKLQG